MSTRIKLIKPYIGFDEVADDLRTIFDSGQLTKGQHVDKFVTGLKDYTAAKHAFLTTSATTALTMSLKAIGVKAGDKVLFGKWSGTEVTIDGEELLMMKEGDIMGIIA